ncbi:MAG: DivIVA domain-containing protein [Deltaproteobacteria bacterium]|nr:DivIVA domain-containing protein [Deltaproteobacteria bacterium]
MRMTPLDVQSHRFAHRLRGYDPDEVDAFLRMVSEDYEGLVRENDAQGDRIRRLERRVEELSAQEDLLKETLISAKSMIEEMRSRRSARPRSGSPRPRSGPKRCWMPPTGGRPDWRRRSARCARSARAWVSRCVPWPSPTSPCSRPSRPIPRRTPWSTAWPKARSPTSRRSCAARGA